MTDAASRDPEAIFDIHDSPRHSKVVPLDEAVRRHVEAGMSLYFATIHNLPTAAICEVIRQFWGKQPEFTVITRTVKEHLVSLVYGGLAKRVITGYVGDAALNPGPNPICQAIYLEKAVAFESWSYLTLVKRLMAGALDIGFMPTKSLIGSSMADENGDAFQVVDDPFGSGRKLGVVKALNADLAVVHGWAADSEGNTIIAPPYGDDVWGALGARQGVLVTVEKVVPAEVIRRYSAYVRVPGYIVKTVSVAPFGSHPGGLSSHGLPDFEEYAEDYEFILQFRRACRTAGGIDAFIKEWILDCPAHRAYVTKLGEARLAYLKGKLAKDAWQHELAALSDAVFSSRPFTRREMMTIVAARKIRELALARGYKIVLGGAGIPYLAACMATYQFKKEGEDVEFLIESGMTGHIPAPVDPWLFKLWDVSWCKMLGNFMDTLGTYVGGMNNHCLGALGVGLIDKLGNIDTTKVGDSVWISGSGGGNDVASGAREVIAIAEQSKQRLVERVPYITSPGDKVTTLVTNLGILQKQEPGGELVLAAVFPGASGEDRATLIAAARESCGWDLKTAPELIEVAAPTADELRMLRGLDPRGYLLGTAK